MYKNRFFIAALAAIMCMACLSGCGKTEEESAIDELQSYVEEDTTSLDDYVDDVNEFVGGREEMDELINSEYLPEITSTWEAYIASQSFEEAKKNAEAFNKAYDNLMKLKDNEYTSEYELINAVIKATSGGSKITDCEFSALEVFNAKVMSSEYNIIEFCYGVDDNDFLFYCHNDNDINGIVIKSDGSECVVNINTATVFAGNNGVYLEGIDSNVMILRVVDENYNDAYYSVDISGDNAGEPASTEYNFEVYYDQSNVNKTIDALISCLNSVIE